MSNNDIIILVIAAINVIFAMVVNTQNIQSAFVFKVIPLFSGFLLALIALKVI